MLIIYHHDVRTTLTLDEDVAAKLKREVRRTGRAFKDVVNDFLRRALNAPPQPAQREPFVVRPRTLGLKAGLSYDHVEELIEQLDGPGHR